MSSFRADSRKCRRRVVKGLVLVHDGVVEDGGADGQRVPQKVLPDDHQSHARAPDVLLGASVDNTELRGTKIDKYLNVQTLTLSSPHSDATIAKSSHKKRWEKSKKIKKLENI